ncbi:peptidylprolyl isomerase [Streptomyces sp. H10-C2]|uniref:peptidylprolyl isomerase n=1 Tax=unclassified Streptomyces TaxID=2593676 RepID=UPI0024B8BFC6|nr:MULTISPECIES: peptidylprolyl isomerase [unclassified Streptomyces]MDJ0345289.1 peptidylprolyl isomerase [Streptomyces sp. PH10-H1]MDJ0370740.1 peptidylprolyl isomerase [Streptomyces sp. H10-C2]
MVTKEQRRRQLAREKFERQQQRRTAERSKSRRRNAVVAAVVAVVVAAGATAYATGSLGGKDKAKTDAAATTPPPASKAPDPCAKPGAGVPGKAQWKTEPAMAIDKSAKYTFTLQTTCGDIALSLDAAKAPATVNSFTFLAGKGFFDHTKCHRLTTTGIYVLQCGDPTGTGQGGPGYKIPDENLKDTAIAKGTYPAGTVAMANQYNAQAATGRNSGGSQFFLVYKDSPLPADYTPFGTIGADGMKVLQKIAAAGAQAPDAQQNTAPNATVVIDKAVVKQS